MPDELHYIFINLSRFNVGVVNHAVCFKTPKINSVLKNHVYREPSIIVIFNSWRSAEGKWRARSTANAQSASWLDNWIVTSPVVLSIDPKKSLGDCVGSLAIIVSSVRQDRMFIQYSPFSDSEFIIVASGLLALRLLSIRGTVRCCFVFGFSCSVACILEVSVGAVRWKIFARVRNIARSRGRVTPEFTLFPPRILLMFFCNFQCYVQYSGIPF